MVSWSGRVSAREKLKGWWGTVVVGGGAVVVGNGGSGW